MMVAYCVLPILISFNVVVINVNNNSSNIRETTSRLKISSEKWVDFARTAFSVDPRIALCLAARFPTNNHLKAEVTQLVQVCFSFPFISFIFFN